MSKRIAIMQPYIFPYIGYFQLVNCVDKFIFYDDVTFIKQGWINRNKIIINNKEFLFTIPLANASSYRKIADVKVNLSLHRKVKKKLYKGIEQAYSKSPYYTNAIKIIKNTLDLETDSISEMAQYSVKAISNYLELNTEFSQSKNVYHNENLRSQDRVINIVLKEGGYHYINPIGGKNLYHSDAFKENDLKLSFLKVDDNLKDRLIIDILMNYSRKEINDILNQYNIIK